MNISDHKTYPLPISWKALSYYNLYSFLIAFLFVSLFWISQLPEPLGSFDPRLFAITAHSYLLVALVAGFFIQLKKPPFVIQVTGHVLVDILVITLFIYSSSGLNSGFGMLMVITIAGGSILIPGRVGFFFAAIATLCVLGHEVYIQLSPFRPPPNYTHAGILGLTFFLTAFISHVLAARVEKSEALAEKRAVDLENLARLNEHIVQRLQSGIIVLDEKLKIQLANESAGNLIGKETSLENYDLDNYCPKLIRSVRNWLSRGGAPTFIINPENDSGDLQVSLVKLNMENKIAILIFLDDVSRLKQQAQQLKLASLGRLTASIAHEVRNPLGAISHAAQLLLESDELAGEERKLTSIITEQSTRVNSIIENVMRISRRERAEPTVINLCEWLKIFVAEVNNRFALDKEDIQMELEFDLINANMDPDQLYQVMWNICENGIRYSRNTPLLIIHCGIHPESNRPFIDIMDSGTGIQAKIAENLFEPFVTTETKGTGLGLFIARELCEANQATLNLYSNTSVGCKFRINFSHPERRQRIA